jgi:hypothetical protein
VVSKELWGELRVTIELSPGKFVSVPLSWTDLAPPDPYRTIGQGRSWFRVMDLRELAELIATRWPGGVSRVK